MKHGQIGWRRVAPALLLTALVSSAALATDYVGSYSGSRSISRGGQVGKLSYELKLDKDGRAQFTIKRTGSMRFDANTFREYGDLMSYVEVDPTVVQEGRWDSERGELWVDFDHIRYRGTSTSAEGYVRFDYRDGVLSIVDQDRSMYGRNDDLKLRRIGAKRNDLLTGLAVLAVGALVLSAARDSNTPSSEFAYDTGGSGSIRFGNGGNESLNGANFKLLKNGRFEVNFRGSGTIDLYGTWRRTNRGYELSLTEISVIGNREPASGNGTLIMSNDRRTVRRVELEAWLQRTRCDGSLDFTSARG